MPQETWQLVAWWFLLLFLVTGTFEYTVFFLLGMSPESNSPVVASRTNALWIIILWATIFIAITAALCWSSIRYLFDLLTGSIEKSLAKLKDLLQEIEEFPEDEMKGSQCRKEKVEDACAMYEDVANRTFKWISARIKSSHIAADSDSFSSFPKPEDFHEQDALLQRKASIHVQYYSRLVSALETRKRAVRKFASAVSKMPRDWRQVIAREQLIKEVLEVQSAIRSMWGFKHENPTISQRTTKRCFCPNVRQEIAELVGTTIELVRGWEADYDYHKTYWERREDWRQGHLQSVR